MRLLLNSVRRRPGTPCRRERGSVDLTRFEPAAESALPQAHLIWNQSEILFSIKLSPKIDCPSPFSILWLKSIAKFSIVVMRIIIQQSTHSRAVELVTTNKFQLSPIYHQEPASFVFAFCMIMLISYCYVMFPLSLYWNMLFTVGISIQVQTRLPPITSTTSKYHWQSICKYSHIYIYISIYITTVGVSR